ncbi:MAG: hypothetical protein AB8B96_05115 [Lysobacterales bacterium]
MNRSLIKILTISQIVCAAVVLVYALTLPGTMMVIYGAIGLLYLLSAIFAHRQSLPGRIFSFIFTMIVCWKTAPSVLTVWHVSVLNPSDWPIDIVLYGYFSLTTFALSASVLLMHLFSWPWLIHETHPGNNEPPDPRRL